MTERDRKKDRENKGKMKKLCRLALIGFIMLTLSACGSSAGGDDEEIQIVEAEPLRRPEREQRKGRRNRRKADARRNRRRTRRIWNCLRIKCGKCGKHIRQAAKLF